jgi:hypothetical protein
MLRTETLSRARVSEAPSSGRGHALLTLLLVGLAVAASLAQLVPPRAEGENVAASEFSAARAMHHLRVIAAAPHPTGGSRQGALADYLVGELGALGLEAQKQETPVVANVLGRLKGSGGGTSVLLVAHYDSTPDGPGASDDGSAVAAILETARALRAGTPLKNDLVCLFTDGEELGLLGAKAFVYNHPWAKQVGVVLNFDARGSGGPVLMFEPGREDAWVVEQLAQAAPAPVANSLMPELYGLLPNDTDFTIFREEGMPGLNFAHFNGYGYYHSRADTVENLAPRSLQHQGSYALSLARQFGGVEAAGAREGGDAVYFNTLGGVLAHYPRAWVWPLTLISVGCFIGCVAWGLRRGVLTVVGVGMGALAVVFCLFVTGVVVSVAWQSIKVARAEASLRASLGRVEDVNLYVVGLALLAAAAAAAVYSYLRGRVAVEDLSAGGLGWLALLAAVAPLLTPGGSYLFQWPLLFGSLGLALMLAARAGERFKRAAEPLVVVCGLPALVLWTPMLYFVMVGLTLDRAWLVAMACAPLAGALAPHMNSVASLHRWFLPATATAAGICVLFTAG